MILVQLKNAFIMVILLSWTGMATAQFSDDFSDGDFTHNPTWIGVDSLWKIDLGLLNSNSHTTNTQFTLATPSSNVNDTEWRWRSLLSFSTSSLNYVDFYLTSDRIELDNNPSGYFLRIGGTKDEISLYRNDAGINTLLIDGTDSYVPSNSDFNIRVTHKNGTWKVYAQDLKNGASSYAFLDSVVDQSLTTSSYFGILVAQSTASFFEKHFFDDFYVGPLVLDTTPPIIANVNILSGNELDVYFDEPLQTDLSNASFQIVGMAAATDVVLDVDDQSLVHITFPQNMVNGQNILEYGGIKDLEGNENSGDQYEFTYVMATQHMIVINEVFADFNPQIGLPDCKYIELHNTSSSSIDMTGWSIVEEDKVMVLPNYVIEPEGFVLLTSSTTQAVKLAPYGDVLVASNFPSLSVSGSEIMLISDEQTLIHYMEYNKQSYQNAVKAEGGYSLELIDPSLACLYLDGYRASEANIGGTPGMSNSLELAGFEFPELDILSVAVQTSDTISVKFNKSIRQDIPSGFTVSIDNQLAEILPPLIGQASNVIRAKTAQNIVPQVVYELVASDAAVCDADESHDAQYRFGIPSEDIEQGDVLINEIMYAPPTGHEDWIEVYNASSKILALSDIVLASRDDFGELKDVDMIESEKLLLPGEYYVLADEDGRLMSEYTTVKQPENILLVNFSLSLNSDDDWVVLLDHQGQVLDEVHYDDNWQYELINDTKGVSLERISESEPTNDQQNWHSAAADAGYSTPTTINSVDLTVPYGEQIDLSSDILSPDGDGQDDFLIISYTLDQPDFLMNAKLFDIGGYLVADVIRNQTLSTDGFYKWDGVDMEGSVIAPGIYILWVEVYSIGGNRIIRKFPLTIAMR